MKTIISSCKILSLIFGLSSLTGCLEQKGTVVVNAPIEEVWAYVSDSNNAADWSIFFDHITPQPGIKDGQVGSLRRCFRWADETGFRWDETVEEVRAPYFKHIRTFNITNAANPQMEKSEFDVYHILRRLGPNQTELTFSSKVREYDASQLASLDLLKAHRLGSKIVQLNLENIKHLIESKQDRRNIPYSFISKPLELFDKEAALK